MSDEHYQPEVGQMLFGCKTGSHAVDELGEAAIQHVLREIDRVFWNVNQRQWDREEDPRIPGVAYRRYYWGECDCGGDERLSKWAEVHDDACYQTDYYKLPEKVRHDFSGKKDAIVKALCEKHGIPWRNGIGSAVHCTCEHDKLWARFSAQNGCTAQCSTVLPNLASHGVEVRWYKHSGRGLSVQKPMDAEAWRTWLNETINTIRSADAALLRAAPRPEDVTL